MGGGEEGGRGEREERWGKGKGEREKEGERGKKEGGRRKGKESKK